MFFTTALSKQHLSMAARFLLDPNVLFIARILTQNSMFSMLGVSDGKVADTVEVIDIQVYQLPRLHVVRHIRLTCFGISSLLAVSRQY